MPTESTLLAHLTPRLTDRVEDMAVEALGYILSKSLASRSALNRVLKSVATELNPVTRVQTQVSDNNLARPDLVGFDEQGKERVLIEAKFWAGLTDNQPTGYLDRLPSDGPSVLLFVAPETRRDTLWGELRRRLNANLIDVSEGDGLWSGKVGDSSRHLALTSWRSLLGQMANQSSGSGESSAQIDIRQLQGLTERMDEEAFLPMQAAELAPAFPRRMLGLNRLVDDATQRGVRGKWITTGGLQVTSRPTGYGRYMRLGGATVWFGVSFELWAGGFDTPLWLDFRGIASGTVKIEQLRRSLGLSHGEEHVPIRLPVGVEYESVLYAVVDELQRIGREIEAGRNSNNE